ncbi:MAG: prepilin-type N-terminal cleavage/methylation domain-containing protein [bacterium]|nr:prepilin-type N-terminal cleavage/methylation domain-containing protein [bacterium]
MTRFYLINKGFTLIELLVVIAVVGVLAGAVIAIINIPAQLGRARDAQRKSDMHAIKDALERYLIDNGHYPIQVRWVVSSSDTWIPGLSPYYLKRIPRDPINNGGYPWNEDQNYRYAYGSDTGQIYDLVSKLENAQDPDRCEIKKWVYRHSGNAWCPPGLNYSNRVYSTTDVNN